MVAVIMRRAHRAKRSHTSKRYVGVDARLGDWCYAVVAQTVGSTGTEVAAECFADDVGRGGVLRGSAFVHCSSQLGVESDG